MGTFQQYDTYVKYLYNLQQVGITLPENGGTGCNNSPYTITLGGNFTTTNQITLNASAPSDIVLPTTGTLATQYGEELFENKIIAVSELVDSTVFFTHFNDELKKLGFDLADLTGTTTLKPPNYNGTIATLAGTETLTNKTFIDSSTIFADGNDINKKCKFDLFNFPTGTSVITIPFGVSGSQLLLTNDNTQYVRNKEFDDSTTTFSNIIDSSRKMRFDLSGISSSTTRIFKMPNTDGTISVDKQTLVNITSANSPYTITNIVSQTIIINNGSSINSIISLPTAVNNSGITIKVIRTDNNPTKSVYIIPYGLETIDAKASVQLWTMNEKFILVCNGTGWYVEQHYARTEWIGDTGTGLDITAYFPGGTPVNPTKATNRTDVCRWRRDGKIMLVERFYSQTNTGTAGSGEYQFGFPLASTYSPDFQAFYTTFEGGGGQWQGKGQVIGTCTATYSAATSAGVIIPNSDNTYRLFTTGSSTGCVGADFFQLSLTTVSYSCSYAVTIVEWDP